MPVTLLGIRHHGPGSARHVIEYLKKLTPDLIVLEAPSEAEEILPVLKSPDLNPPVAMLAYQTDLTKNAVFYPFAVFSPEWQALQYAQKNDIPVRCFDLPLTHSLALQAQKFKESVTEEEVTNIDEADSQVSQDTTTQANEADQSEQVSTAKSQEAAEDQVEFDAEAKASAGADAAADKEAETDANDDVDLSSDPFDYLAQIEGVSDGETWWEMKFEQRQDASEIFEAVQIAVTELRESLPSHTSERDLLREAWMRKVLRAAEKEYQNIVVICGAWHVPALAKRPPVKDDNARLKGLPKVKVAITWIPWTYSRLAFTSGYGAGIVSPGWYHHLFFNYTDDGSKWLTKVARVLRKDGKDISVAHVIETLSLAQTLAALRNLAHPTLTEFKEAITTVMGFGDSVILYLVDRKLAVSERMGKVPDDVPKVPLLVDIEQQQKKLRIVFGAEEKQLTLDLRKALDLNRSIFFNRLKLLGVKLAKLKETSNTNTFRELWELKFDPEQILTIIDRAVYGSDLVEAVTAYTQEQIQGYNTTTDLSELLFELIPCDLPQLVLDLTKRLDVLSASSQDMLQLMQTIPTLVKIIRYGSVRKFDVAPIDHMLQTIIGRILAGAVLICINIDEEAAETVEKSLSETNYALKTLNNPEYTKMWLELMEHVFRAINVHALLSGSALRVLREHDVMQQADLEKAISYYTSFANEPKHMAYWLQGFLKNGGLMLVHDDALWMLVNNFLKQLDPTQFEEMLPILRRTFVEFSDSERRKLGNKAKSFSEQDGLASSAVSAQPEESAAAATANTNASPDTSASSGADNAAGNGVNEERAQKVISLIGNLMGINLPSP